MAQVQLRPVDKLTHDCICLWDRNTPGIEMDRLKALDISDQIPEEHLILMFPFTYLAYRTILAACYAPFHHYDPDRGVRGANVNEVWLGTFKEFLSYVGPAPGDMEEVH